jgi:pimeloyl-ACP methyl ester carboxylesterase
MPYGVNSRRACLEMERLESRDLPSAAMISGTVFQTLDVAGLFPQSSGTFDAPVANVQVFLDHGASTVTGSNGAYSFANLTPGSHVISIQPPKGFVGFSSEGLSDTVVVSSQEQFPNVNFALTPKTEALVQNLFELVLQRPADLAGFNSVVQKLNTGGSVGQAYAGLLSSAEFRSNVAPLADTISAFFPVGATDIGLLRNSVQLENLGITPDAAELNILYSQKFVSAYGDTSLLSNSQFVTFVFQHLVLQNPTSQQLQYWVDGLNAGTFDRGQVLLGVVGSSEFRYSRPFVERTVDVSLAYLGILGRQASPLEIGIGDSELAFGRSLTSFGNQLAGTTEYQTLQGFTDTFVWDVLAQQVKPAVDPLSRLRMYDAKTQQFDLPVQAGSITSSAYSPVDVYFVAHGWAPGYTEDVLLHSTPGDPLKWWQTIQYPGGVPTGPDSPWLFGGVSPISDEGLAQAIVQADPNAVVIAFSWIDQSATPESTNMVQLSLPGSSTANSITLTVSSTSQLSAGMSVTGPGIPSSTIITTILSATQVALSNLANSHAGSGPFAFQGVNLAATARQLALAGQSESYTQLDGLRLAEAVQEALSPSFFTGAGLIHLLGHSHGAKVATVAALALQQAGKPVAQLTLFESPEGGPDLGTLQSPNPLHLPGLGGADNFDWYYLRQMNISRTPVQVGTRTPTPPTNGQYPTFVDNYYSQQGLGSAYGGFTGLSSFGAGSNDLSSVVDVLLHPEDLYGSIGLSDPSGALGAIFGSHDYPPPWYAQASLQSPSVNALSWSPLLNAGNSTNLANFYEQQQQSTPAMFLTTQFQLNSSSRPSSITYTPTTMPLQYAQQYAVGNVTDNGSTIGLSVSASHPDAIDAITFNPLAATGASGTGLDFNFTFSSVKPGQHVELVVWIRGMVTVPQAQGILALGSTTGYMSVPLFTMDSADAGTSTQGATLSLDGYHLGLLTGLFDSVATFGTAAPNVPTLGFTLISSAGSSATVTVTNMNQITDGIGG